MKNYLAVDTSNEYLTVIACKDGVETVAFEPHCGMQHSVRLMGAVEETLSRAGLSPEACDFFCAVTGPGSFTGIRIGISCAKGLSAALAKPAVGITSFQTLAYNAEGKALAAIAAGRGNYYVCGFAEDKSVCLEPAYVGEEKLRELAADFPVFSCDALPVPYVQADPAAGLLRAVQALAWIRGRDYATPDDVKRLAVPVLAHRVIVRGLYGQTKPAETLIEDVLAETPVPTEAVSA